MRAIDKIARRTVLRGVLGGAAVTVGVPVLDSMLDTNGVVLAATGRALPPCFGTYFWALGLAYGQWVPKEVGTNYELPAHLENLKPIKAKMNLFSGMQTFLDGKANQNHYSGAQCQMTGFVSKNGSDYTTSLDTLIGNKIGQGTRFRSLEVGLDGGRDASWSARGPNGINPAEISPIDLYARIFGPEFKDPNASAFTPDTNTMLRRSVLSSVSEQRKALLREVSATDRSRLDEYFSSIRDLEQQMAVQLQKPAPLPACSVPTAVEGWESGRKTTETAVTNKQFATLIAHALSCGQTRIFNFSTGSAFSRLQLPEEPLTYHVLSHDEPVDPAAGYQPKCKRLAEASMGFYSDIVETLDSIREGDRTLLDRSIVFAFTDHGEARLHSMKHFPIFTAGSGGGRLKTGYHLHAEGDTVTRVGFTLQQVFGLPEASWGTESNQTSRPFTEIMA